jgi:hypothetical protein
MIPAANNITRRRLVYRKSRLFFRLHPNRPKQQRMIHIHHRPRRTGFITVQPNLAISGPQ